MSIEQTLLRYTDLTPARYAALCDIRDGKPALVNDYCRVVLRDLLTGDCALNAHGANVLQLAGEIIAGKVPEVGASPVKQSVSYIALRIRQYTRFRRMKAAHLRIMVDVCKMPGLSYRYLTTVHSYELIDDLIEWGMVEGRPVTGFPFRITVAGKLFLEKEW